MDINNSISTIEGEIKVLRQTARITESEISAAILSKSEEEVNEELKHFDDNEAKLRAKKDDLNAKLANLAKIKPLMEIVSVNNKAKSDFDKCKDQKEEESNKLKEIQEKLAVLFSKYDSVGSGSTRLVNADTINKTNC